MRQPHLQDSIQGIIRMLASPIYLGASIEELAEASESTPEMVQQVMEAVRKVQEEYK